MRTNKEEWRSLQLDVDVLGTKHGCILQDRQPLCFISFIQTPARGSRIQMVVPSDVWTMWRHSQRSNITVLDALQTVCGHPSDASGWRTPPKQVDM